MKLESVKKIGPKTEKLLNKLNIFSVEDLLNYYPYRYNFINIINIKDAINITCYIKAKILSDVKVYYIRKNFNKLNFIAESNDVNFKVVIFNRAFLKANLTVGREVLLVGKFDSIKNTFVASDINFKIEDNKIEPVYHLTDGIKNTSLINMIQSALECNIEINDYIPENIMDKYNFISKQDAIKYLHKPNDINQIKQAKLRTIYEELFVYMFKINYLNQINKKAIGLKREFNETIINDFLSSLPFKLTEDQLSTINDIIRDLKADSRMNRLVLGDVGSGKTIVATVAILANFISGYQSTFMAPTEILAKQHYDSLINYFSEYNINIVLLTGSTTKKEKKIIYQKILNNEIELVIGTHALLNENLEFANLGLVITDEQHRFGVNQRSLLQNKGVNAQTDVLYLSATPIPRTYALTIYGDMDISQIKSKPNMRKEIITKIKSEDEITDVLKSMLDELKLGHQIYVVSPLIENETSDLNSVVKLKEKLDIAFNNIVPIEIIHGKLKQKEKDELMLKFHQDKIKILISTTVIEVGIDNPNATMMVIFNAEMFGLATLHQLRGRVGRSSLQSYCYLISDNKNNERLRVMEESSDGFYISEKDFEQRGQGDLFGVKQSGDMIFKLADIKNDYKILHQANIDACDFVRNKEYIGNVLYEKIIKEINFLD